MGPIGLLPDFTMMLVVVASVLVVIYLCSLLAWRIRTQGRPLPPGPKRLPFVGNLSAPKTRPWLGFRDLCSEYGDVVYLRTFGQHNVILGSPAVISEFLEKRTANTSDRPASATIHLAGIDETIGFMPYGQRWRDNRRAFWQHFRPEAILDYRPVQHAVTHTFLKKLLGDPLHFKQHIRFTFAASLLKVVYGIDVDDENNEIIRAIDVAMEGPAEAFVPGRFLVDFIPVLRYIPAWFPGGGFKKIFARWRRANFHARDMPFSRRNTRYHAVSYFVPIVDRLLAKLPASGKSPSQLEDIVKAVGVSAFEAGTDTTFSTLQATFLALSLYPKVQRKAQAELDSLVGRNRLPDFDDCASLIYIQAIVKESLRWFNVTPLGMSHRTTEDDEFRGYFIPAGSILIPNIWACMHDTEVYEHPDEFRPERFLRHGKLNPTVRDPSAFVFGSGRRKCPGRFFAEASLLLNVASVLHVFHIDQPLDESGNPIKVELRMSDSFLSYPEGCRCTIRPRSSQAVALIQHSCYLTPM